MTEVTPAVGEDPPAPLVPVNTATMDADEMRQLWRVAQNLAASGMFKDINQAEKAYAKILLGRDLGLSPAQSLQSMDFVKGNVQLRAVTLAGFVRRSEDYDYEVTEHTAETCSVTFWERSKRTGDWRAAGVSTFTMEDAKRAQLVRGGSPWEAHPRNMLWARALSNGVKWYAPDMLGGIPVYTEGDSFDSTAEDITDVPQVGQQRVELAPAVREVVDRAQALRFAAINPATAAMATNGQPDDRVATWVAEHTAMLDAHDGKAGSPPEAEVVDVEGKREQITGVIAELEDEQSAASIEQDDARYDEIEAELSSLREELVALDG